jgi:Fibronectin type III domain
MLHKTPVALVTALAALAAAPVASATITAAPLTIAQSGANVTFTIAAPGASPTPDRIIGLLVAPAGAAGETFSYTAVQGSGEGASTTTASTADCQVVNGSASTMVELPETQYSDATGFTVTVPSSDLPASFDAKAVIADDFDTDTCNVPSDSVGLATTMAGAARFPAPVIAPAPVVTPAPAPAPAPAPVVTPAKPAPAITRDGIKSDWLVGGRPAAAPKPAKVLAVTPHSATLSLPKAPAGATIRVFRRVAGTKTFHAVKVTAGHKHGTVTLSGLKPHTRYELKLVAVNQAGQQTKASNVVTVRTTKP